MILRVFDKDGQLGTISDEGGQLTGSNSAAQGIADSMMRQAGGDVTEAARLANGWSNGYVWVKS